LIKDFNFECVKDLDTKHADVSCCFIHCVSEPPMMSSRTKSQLHWRIKLFSRADLFTDLKPESSLSMDL